MYYRVMSGSECYGCCASVEDANNIIKMHKTTKSGAKKDTFASTKTYTVETMQGEYPSKEVLKFNLGYQPGHYGARG